MIAIDDKPKSHILGYPRVGLDRELKKALEKYWSRNISKNELLAQADELKLRHWNIQKNRGLDFVSVGDFSLYDHMLDHAFMFNIIPERFIKGSSSDDLDNFFRMARGKAPTGDEAHACEMTKWFDTNYHYIVPELVSNTDFKLNNPSIINDTNKAIKAGFEPKPTIVGPLTFLYLSKTKDNSDKLEFLDKLLPLYIELIKLIKQAGAKLIQIDEPILGLDLDDKWLNKMLPVYKELNNVGLPILLASYFSPILNNLNTLSSLPIVALHLDCVRGAEDIENLINNKISLPKILSLGVVNGRNVWKNNISKSLKLIDSVAKAYPEKTLWVGSSCSLLHSPIDIESEKKINAEVKLWLAFATQKVKEVVDIKSILLSPDSQSSKQIIDASDKIVESRNSSSLVNNLVVQNKISKIDEHTKKRSPFQKRKEAQQALYNLPLLPTTSIGSFPQTSTIRQARRDFKSGKISHEQYTNYMHEEIKNVVKVQEDLDMDVLVHGEAERNDMVEYFGELLSGFAFTSNGWVQSYGSRCVKPPIIYGDVQRTESMTVKWSTYAQSLTKKPMKGMLTGPLTILCWSFVRDDLTRDKVCYQISLAIQEEVLDLEKSGITIIQIDEPAFKEGMPLRTASQDAYFDWAIKSFHITANSVKDTTQIHTHMCYSEFNDIIKPIAKLDADVISIETSRSDMELLNAFEDFEYPNDIGPGVYDIHSPLIPKVDEMVILIEKAIKKIDISYLWVNPDCGLKTRGWPETKQALANMMEATDIIRKAHCK